MHCFPTAHAPACPAVLQETLCSLRFAAKVNQCETAAKGGAQRNVTTMEWGSGVAALVRGWWGAGWCWVWAMAGAASLGCLVHAIIGTFWRQQLLSQHGADRNTKYPADPCFLDLQTGRPSLAPTDAEARRMSMAPGGIKRKPGVAPPAAAPRGIPRPRLG